MKVDQGSSFQKLLAGKVETNQKKGEEKAKSADTQASGPAASIRRVIESNSDAVLNISKVATLAKKEDSSSEDSKQIKAKSRDDVEQTNRAASDSKPEDVSNLADLLASRIRTNPEQALGAHGNPDVEKVFQLLQ